MPLDQLRIEYENSGAPARQMTAQRLAILLAAPVILYIGQDVFLPLAIAILITFALSPLVSRLRRTGLPLIWTVLAVVFATGCTIALFAYVVFGQLAQLVENLPTFRDNIIAKVNDLRDTGGPSSLFARLSAMATDISAQMQDVVSGPEGASPPMPVEVIERTSAIDLLTNLVLPLFSPLATTGLVLVVVVFMLLEREQLRERFIRLVGSGDLHRTTQVLEDAGARVGNYLLVQLLVNAIYAVPIGLGLWVIGVPNPVLWGSLTLVLRFVPYIGSAISAILPLLLAFAVSADWSAVLWTAALFLTVELITSNIVEPYLYGSRTGVSPLAIIIAAIFWTFLWGPLGLVLSTPMTVCLVVLGRHIPQFEVFDILFGDEPVLAPHARLYQRLLSGDHVEATFHASEALEDEGLAEFFQTSAIPALLLAQDDRDRGVLLPAQEQRLANTALAMVDDLSAMSDEPPEPGDQPDRRVTCIGGRWELDNASAAILSNYLASEGISARALPAADLAPARHMALNPDQTDCLILCFLDPTPSRASFLHIRRIKRMEPKLRVGVVIWELPADVRALSAGSRSVAAVPAAKLAEALECGADFAVTTLRDITAAALDETPPVEVAAATGQRRKKTPARRRLTPV